MEASFLYLVLSVVLSYPDSLVLGQGGQGVEYLLPTLPIIRRHYETVGTRIYIMPYTHSATWGAAGAKQGRPFLSIFPRI